MRIFFINASVSVFYVLLFCVLSIQNAASQKEAEQDSLYIAMNYDSAVHYLFGKPDSALFFLDLALERDIQNENSLVRWKIITVQAIAHRRKGDFEACEKTNLEALKHLPKPDSLEAFLYVNQNLAALYYDNYNQVDRALKIYEECLVKNDTSTLKLKSVYIGLINNIGLIYKSKKWYDKSVSVYLEGIEFAKKHGFNDDLASLYINISLIYSALEDHPIQLEYAKKAASVKLKQQKAKPSAWSSISSAYAHMNQPDSALYYQSKILNFPNVHWKSKAIALIGQGRIYLAQEKYDLAKKSLLEGMELAKSKNRLRDVGVAYSNLGQIEHNLGNYKKALEYYDLAAEQYEQLEEIKLDKDELFNLERRLKSLIRNGNNEEAYKVLGEYLTQRDSAYQLDLAEKVEMLKIKFETKVMQDSIQTLALEKEINASQLKASKYLNISLFLASFLLILILYLSWKTLQKEKEANQLLEAKITNLVAQIKTQRIEANETYLIDGQEKRLVKYEAIKYIRAADKAIIFELNGDENIWVWKSMKAILEELPEKFFIRIHRSYIANLFHIAKVNGTKLTLTDGTVLAIGKTYRDEILEALKKGE